MVLTPIHKKHLLAQAGVLVMLGSSTQRCYASGSNTPAALA
jgi:hypothetical protein